MIQDKTITITKQNTTNKWWTLLAPYKIEYDKGRLLRYNITDIRTAIARCNRVYLVLKSVCLSSAIVKELEWVNKYVKLEIVAQNRWIIEHYKNLKFDNVIIDRNVQVNYLSIEGPISLSFLIDDGFNKASSSIKESFLGNENIEYSLSGFSKIMFVGSALSENEDLYLKCIEQKKDIYYTICKEEYTQSIYEQFRNSSHTKLLVASFANTAIIGFTHNGGICQIYKTTSGKYFDYPLVSMNDIVGDLYACFNDMDYDSAISDSSLRVWLDKKIVPFHMEEKIVIERTVNVENMEDFVAERFDRSETDNHNDYSWVSKQVVYNYKLMPPAIDKTYKISSIYEPIKEYYKQLVAIKIDLLSIATEQEKTFEHKELSIICRAIEDWYEWLGNTIKSANYNHCYDKTEKILGLISSTRRNLMSFLDRLYTEIDATHEDDKFDKLVAEINEYKQIVLEKQALVERGEEVLKNSRRIEVLNGKIDDLERLKQKFKESSSSRIVKRKEQFLKKCQEIILNKYKPLISEESIGQVLDKGVKTKEILLENFVENHLYAFNRFLENIVPIIENLQKVQIPTEYTIYEKDSQKYLVITSLEEYEKTKEMREKFNIACLTRR